MESILETIRKAVGLDKKDDSFDIDLIMHINSVFSDLNQLGVGPSDGFYIEDDLALWTDFIPFNKKFHSVKTYMQQRVRLLFDPPSNSAVLAAMERSVKEFEWRLNVAAESTIVNSEEIQNG